MRKHFGSIRLVGLYLFSYWMDCWFVVVISANVLDPLKDGLTPIPLLGHWANAAVQQGGWLYLYCMSQWAGALGNLWCIEPTVLGLFYTAVSVSLWQRTPGMWIASRFADLYVERADGTSPRFRDGCILYWGYWVSAFFLFAGFWAMLIDKEHRAWHHRMAGLRVCVQGSAVSEDIENILRCQWLRRQKFSHVLDRALSRARPRGEPELTSASLSLSELPEERETMDGEDK